MRKSIRLVVIEGVTFWTCSDCKKPLPETAYPADNPKYSYCRSCQKIRSKAVKQTRISPFVAGPDDAYIDLIEQLQQMAQRDGRRFIDLIREALTNYFDKRK